MYISHVIDTRTPLI